MKKLKLLLSIIVLLGATVFYSGCNKNEGCTDPASDNFDPEATVNDGSCVYTQTVFEDLGNGQTRIQDLGKGIGTMTLTNDTEWLLDGFVFVNSGQILSIEAGTVIKGMAGSGNNASALVIARGAKIMAQGTDSQPIIFTSESDDVNSDTDIPFGTRGLWGGIIILGDASLNSNPGETSIEGIPTTEPRGLYGGSNDADDSGIFQYCSIRYGGTDIGAGNEINGLTLGGVGNGTSIDHVEVVFNADDGIEFFGGTVNTSHIVIAFVGDDSYDYDEGFRGMGQFWVALQGAGDGDRGGEHDGGTDPETALPYAHPILYNATFIGRDPAEGKRTATFRDNAGGEYHNSIFMSFAKGIDVELLASPEDSYKRFQEGELVLENNVFFNVAENVSDDIFQISAGAGVDVSVENSASAALTSYFSSANNQVINPQLSYSNSVSPVAGIDLRPANSAVLSGAPSPPANFFKSVDYYGAFDGTDNWLSGWTLLHNQGYLK